MNNLAFFTPIHYFNPEKFSETLLETVDHYFYLGGKKATVVSKDNLGNERVLVSNFSEKSNGVTTFLKYLSYFTVIIPAALLLVKGCLRAQHHFKIFDTKKELERGIKIDDAAMGKIHSLIFPIMLNTPHNDITWISKDKDLPTATCKINDIPDVEFVVPNYQFKGNMIFDFSKNTDELYDSIVKQAEQQLIQGKSLKEIGEARTIKISNPMFPECKESLLMRRIHPT